MHGIKYCKANCTFKTENNQLLLLQIVHLHKFFLPDNCPPYKFLSADLVFPHWQINIPFTVFIAKLYAGLLRKKIPLCGHVCVVNRTCMSPNFYHTCVKTAHVFYFRVWYQCDASVIAKKVLHSRPFQEWRAIARTRHNEIWRAMIARHKFPYRTSKKDFR